MTKQLSFLPKSIEQTTQEKVEGFWKVYVYISNLG